MLGENVLGSMMMICLLCIPVILYGAHVWKQHSIVKTGKIRKETKEYIIFGEEIIETPENYIFYYKENEKDIQVGRVKKNETKLIDSKDEKKIIKETTTEEYYQKRVFKPKLILETSNISYKLYVSRNMLKKAIDFPTW